MPYACLALSSFNFRRSLNRKKGRAYTQHKPVHSLFIQIGWSNAEMENQSIDWQNSSFSYNVSQHIKTQVKINRKVYQGIALKRLLKIYFMLAILSKNKTKLVLLAQTMRIEFNMLTWSGERRDKRRFCTWKKKRALTEVTGTQKDNYKQADSFEKSLEIPHHHRSGSSFRGIDSADRIADRSGRL